MAKEQKGKTNRRITEMKFRDLRKILEDNGYVLERRTNSVHAKFTNKEKNHSIVVSGYESGRGRAGRVKYPIVQRTLKECGIKL